MKAVLAGCCLFAFANAGFAHRLDEYLQATRIAIGAHRIDFSFDLTPGVAVAGRVLDLIDRDHDGRVSDPEGKSYARRFLKDLVVSLDGRAVTLRLAAVTLPSVAEMRDGVGVIRIKADARIRKLAPGSHALGLTNRHQPAISAYLVNALRSSDPKVEIGRQTRDELQKEYRLEFRIRSAYP